MAGILGGHCRDKTADRLTQTRSELQTKAINILHNYTLVGVFFTVFRVGVDEAHCENCHVRRDVEITGPDLRTFLRCSSDKLAH